MKMEAEKSRILVVDDMSGFLKVTKIFLERHGFDVRIAGHAKDALDILRDWQPDVLVTDLMMPEVSGFDLLSQLQEQQLSPGTRVIVVTGRTDPRDEIRARSLGATAVLFKPYSKEELLKLCQTAVPNA